MRLKLITAQAALLGAFSLAPVLLAQTTPATQPDNTKVNERDRSKTAATADKAKNNAADLETMKKIRSAIVDDKSLSTYGHNVKVIAKDGKVTLKGPVNSDEEKRTIEQTATGIAGAGNVVDQMTVKPARTTKEKK
jgi:osmotically-inducible protein OsmY